LRFRSCLAGLLPFFLLTACAHLPPAQLIDDKFLVAAPVGTVRAVCEETLITFLRARSGGDRVVRNVVADSCLVSCSIVRKGVIRSHWNVLTCPAAGGRTCLRVCCFVLDRAGYVPVSRGDEERAFVSQLVKRVRP
jgi:hypothetical protein